MGTLFYGTDRYGVELDDRALAHLKVALLTLLRAQQSVALTIARPVSQGSGRDTMWINPTSDLRFHFSGNRPPRINESWVRAIIATANTPSGMRLPAEDEAAQPSRLLNA
ncbi:hypothetical protein [Frigoribacterium sp. Leaf172]|uniref:DUF7882 family protein n=1 Tax=Frigoribacterium sp. Leaf172 TaxID=1736285 RepID=UPI0006FD2768|nr:hypothetical protein [Frigoribacterium sp. Leaf172]KQR63893.1 hypothetical protein ASF89_12425 [Frigoribacterium sp. Leaf172]